MNKLTNVIKLGWVGVLASTFIAGLNTEFGLMGFQFVIGVWCSTKIISEAILAAGELINPPLKTPPPSNDSIRDSISWVQNTSTDNW